MEKRKGFSRSAKITFAVIWLVLFGLPQNYVFADVAPPPNPSTAGLEPPQFQETNVQMVYERVEMELAINPSHWNPYFNNQIKVDAWFVMRNLGDVDETMQVVYPMHVFDSCPFFNMQASVPPSYASYTIEPDSFTATIDGTQVSIEYIQTEYPEPPPWYCNDLSVDWAAFEVAFPAGQDILIQISYLLDNGGGDAIQNIQYILETGAAWRGPIKEGHITFRFPYVVEENILDTTSPGYQVLYNEIHWSFENLEPTWQDNVIISYIAPETWKMIQTNRQRIEKDETDTEAWINLSNFYSEIANWHGTNVREPTYVAKAFTTLKQAIAANPANADLYAELAEETIIDCCFPFESYEDAQKVLPLLDKIFQLDAQNQKARDILSDLARNIPSLTYTFPPTLTPAQSYTPTQTRTPRPAATKTPIPTASHSPTTSKTATHQPSPTVSATHTKMPTESLSPVPTLTKPFEVDRAVPGYALAGTMLILLAAGVAYAKMRLPRNR